MNVKKWIKESNCSYKWVNEKIKNGAEYRWLKKKVYSTKLLWNGTNLDQVSLKGVGNISLVDKMIKLELNDDVEDLVPRPNCTISINLDNSNYEEYNRISLMVYPEAVGFVNFYTHISFGNTDNVVVHAPSVTPNKWNHIVFEVGDIKRDKVPCINFTPFLFGTPPEALPEISFLIKDIKIEKVELDQTEGWSLGKNIAYSHVGYFIDKEKTALIESKKESEFYLKDKSKNIVYTGVSKKIDSDLGEFCILDFSEYQNPGEYYLEIEDVKSNIFEISNNPYLLSIWKSIQFLRTLRCGEEVEHVHSACHLNCRTVAPDGTSLPNFGGWHDAGDVSQFEICTAEMVEAILELSKKVESTDKVLSKRLLEEAKVGVNWILRTIFPNGERALAVGYNIWRKNVLKPTNEAVKRSVSEKGPFENFLACSCLLTAYNAFKDVDKIYSDWCLRTALLDYEVAVDCYNKGIHTKRWGSNVDSQVSGIGASCASKLYLITKDEKYKLHAKKYGKIILGCQQQEYPDWDIPIRGFFYEDIDHKYMLTYEHRGHEQNPIAGLVSLCETFKEDKEYNLWINGIKLYAEYIKATKKYTSPYGMISGHVYDLNKFNMERFTIAPYKLTTDEALEDLKEQARHGIKLSNDVYLRRFPVAIQRRGYHATLLSKAKAISLAAKILKDKELEQIVIDQLEWIMGKNPFSTSSMYGEGYNYHPLYVAYSPQLVGALPVGFKTLGYNDAPYWPVVNNAVFKEIWGHTTGKYLHIFVDILN